MRVVSLLPSATEIVGALGAAGDLVGVSHECDHPPEVAGRPVLTSSRLLGTGASGDLDRSVRELLRAALAIYDLDVERLAGRDVEVVSLHPLRLDDIWADIRRVAAAIGRRDAGEALVAGLLERLVRLERRAAGAVRPRVVSIEWLDPVMLGGTWMPELIRAAGGDPLGWRRGSGPRPSTGRPRRS